MKPVRRTARQWLLMTHVVFSLGWLGAGAANLVIAVTAATTSSFLVRQVCYDLIDRLDFALVIPLAFGSLASGVLISIATKWGLARHWWVLSKLSLTVAVIAFSTFGVGVWVELSIAATSSTAEPSPVAARLVVGASANIIAFLSMTWISITKPGPKTPWTRSVPGRRRRPVPPQLSGGGVTTATRSHPGPPRHKANCEEEVDISAIRPATGAE